ncbi:DUF763 domain-containing protein [Virgibacillus siamensis]|uniref:DUF763 domain-containing protein n=1 Tax=Virgibacillus siamensis TaxID=480071 RepID=UPI003D160899
MANSPLHGGHCPPWLFTKMKELGASIVQTMVMEYGTEEVLRRLSDPVWFQSFGSVLGFDWHSSGLTTVVCGALKEGLRQAQGEMGLFLVGGKGKASRKTPIEIMEAGERYGLSNDIVQLQQTSRTVAKVDSAAVQDGYQLYHHFLVFDRSGNWAVIQQGMNDKNRYARRYHWLSEEVKDFTNSPQKAVCGVRKKNVLNLVSGQNQTTRLASVEVCQERPDDIKEVYNEIITLNVEKKNQGPQQLSLFDEGMWGENETTPDKEKRSTPLSSVLTMPESHPIPSPRYLDKILYKIYDKPPETYQQLLETEGVGPGTLRALAMVAEVTHGSRPSFEDPVRYAFAHGGKDGYPFPVQRGDITQSLNVLREAIEKGKIGEMDKLKSLRRLAKQENLIGGKS